jgi:hypothetical protein
MLPEGCEVSNCPQADPSDGFTDEQEEKLRKRKRSMPEDDKWQEIYMILFPDVDPQKIPSPCEYDPMSSVKFK